MMIEAYWLNVGSLLFGLIALIIPIVSILKNNSYSIKKCLGLMLISFSACGISLCMQMFYTNHLVNIEDWGALMDTSNAVSVVSLLLLIANIVLNYISISKRAS